MRRSSSNYFKPTPVYFGDNIMYIPDRPHSPRPNKLKPGYDVNVEDNDDVFSEGHDSGETGTLFFDRFVDVEDDFWYLNPSAPPTPLSPFPRRFEEQLRRDYPYTFGSSCAPLNKIPRSPTPMPLERNRSYLSDRYRTDLLANPATSKDQLFLPIDASSPVVDEDGSTSPILPPPFSADSLLQLYPPSEYETDSSVELITSPRPATGSKNVFSPLYMNYTAHSRSVKAPNITVQAPSSQNLQRSGLVTTSRSHYRLNSEASPQTREEVDHVTHKPHHVSQHGNHRADHVTHKAVYGSQHVNHMTHGADHVTQRFDHVTHELPPRPSSSGRGIVRQTSNHIFASPSVTNLTFQSRFNSSQLSMATRSEVVPANVRHVKTSVCVEGERRYAYHYHGNQQKPLPKAIVPFPGQNSIYNACEFGWLDSRFTYCVHVQGDSQIWTNRTLVLLPQMPCLLCLQPLKSGHLTINSFF